MVEGGEEHRILFYSLLSGIILQTYTHQVLLSISFHVVS